MREGVNMAEFMKKLRRLEEAFDLKAARFVAAHPLAGFIIIFIGMPIFVLIAVGISTTIIMLPISWLLGWL